MTEHETSEPGGDPFEEAYRAYIRVVQEFWANVDVEALVRDARRSLDIHPMNTLAGCHGALLCYGTYGTIGTIGTVATTGAQESSEEAPD